jgi:indolepyruvate ferredoxin oxidoreductase alpha subunit
MKRHAIIEERMETLAEDANALPVNRVELRDKKIGVITSGIPYQYVREALPEASVLKLGLVNPLPKKLIQDFADQVDTLYVIEELDPMIETQVRAMGIECKGKELFTPLGEYSANMLRTAILGETVDAKAPAQVPGRPPILCPGCPHRSVFYVLKKLGIHAAGDIGCYTLGAVAPLQVVDSTICMGASISSLHGIEKAAGKDFVKNWVAVIGDSTFLHTGVNSLMNMAYNKASGTVIILDNSTTGMTGHQDHAATGYTLAKETTNAVNIPELCHALGVKHVQEINAFDLDTLETAIKEANADDEIHVIITKTPCVLLDKRKKPLYVSLSDKCKKCGMCLKPGCPAISKQADGTVRIDDTMCTGCGLCETLCKFEAIEKVGE